MPLGDFFDNDTGTDDIISSSTTNNHTASSSDPSTTATLASPLVARFLYSLCEQPSISDGLLYGAWRTRVRRAVSDAVDAGDAVHHIADIKRFVMTSCVTSTYSTEFFDEAAKRGAGFGDASMPLVDLSGAANGPLCDRDTSSLVNRADQHLIGWFSFNRVIDESFLCFYEEMTKKLRPLVNNNKNPLLFLWAFEREIGSEFKLTMQDVQLRLYQFDDASERLRAIAFKIANVGDTSHAEYGEVLDRPPLGASVGGDASSASLRQTIVDALQQDAERIGADVDAQLKRAADRLRHLDAKDTSPKKRCDSHPNDAASFHAIRAIAAMSSHGPTLMAPASLPPMYIMPSHPVNRPPDYYLATPNAQPETPDQPRHQSQRYLMTPNDLECDGEISVSTTKLAQKQNNPACETLNNLFQQEDRLFTTASSVVTRGQKREKLLHSGSSSAQSDETADLWSPKISESPASSIASPPKAYADQAKEGSKTTTATHNTKKSKNDSPICTATKGRGRRQDK